ncbi:hypothetical protein CEXT_147371 [Caerostris extrusa]|uniref:Uncharacterized protein n=1 Tax=Caerostris extrusa TaxID=172846 RepID=A0AAV4M728_CAEEX|nr:hypothetical protein CEXT_147371 [Caerostris extrusa]
MGKFQPQAKQRQETHKYELGEVRFEYFRIFRVKVCVRRVNLCSRIKRRLAMPAFPPELKSAEQNGSPKPREQRNKKNNKNGKFLGNASILNYCIFLLFHGWTITFREESDAAS